jgi:hypothetical protein
LALEAFVGVTVYLRLPHPVGGVDAETEVQVPANASMLVVGPVGPVGVVSFLDRRSHPAVRAHASAKTAAAARSFIDPPYRLYDF